ncbi:T9SS type A sorting domain-containing protein [Flavitalea sp. BT771]|uniref:T9SS type A sorting domain-containing protein n=1 Tax=Flavitalea sp. BT771 TaxID=3063329 RepID=UPI0026E22D04|nr:T9SS type A sorting domain-containing protein [Flavitalea sp. BT771]MDO6430782.1 T9SS type A sorting domain-containing protein [Flavitalea sp. BT771]MDV6219078.1 T9SS type A sorting domain-containing protein [Flavitalea sp. BT771]
MPKPLQLHIPSPCHEDWASMHPSGNGRHCMACRKTVVDFTAMSDAEILQYMRGAASQVCGRLTPGQMKRDLAPSPVQKNGGKGWPWLIAGALMTADGTPPERTGLKGKVVLQSGRETTPMADTTAIISENEFMVGLLVSPAVEHELEPMYDPVETSIAPVIGTMPAVAIDALPPPEISSVDTSASVSRDTLDDFVRTGGIQLEASSLPDSPSVKIRQFLTDTLTALHILPRKEMGIYPNPIRRGTPFHITWPSGPGTYKVSLISAAGVLIETRVAEVGGSAQVDTWEMPGELATGVYLIQAVRPGHSHVWTQKVIVE